MCPLLFHLLNFSSSRIHHRPRGSARAAPASRGSNSHNHPPTLRSLRSRTSLRRGPRKTPGTATAEKAVVLDTNSHIDTVKTAALHIGTSGSETEVTSTATQLNYLNGLTAVIETNLAAGTAATHTTLASAKSIKTYVDDTRTGLEVKDSVVVATTGNITLSGTQTIDGIAVTAGQRVLVKDQSIATQNGIYVVASGAWSRSTDADTAEEFNSGCFFFVEKGTANADNGFVMSQDATITFGTTDITFSQFSGAGQITAGDGLAKTGDTLSVNTSTGITVTNDNVVIDTAWTGQTAITTVGTIGTGTWNGTAIATGYIAAALTSQTSMYNAALKIGRDTHNQFDFATDNVIKVSVNAVDDEFRFAAGGDFHADGDVYAYSGTTASDVSLKKNITDTKYGLDDIMKLRGVDFNWKEKFEGKIEIRNLSGIFDEVFQEIKEPFLELITNINKKYHSFEWWGNDLASRSPGATPLLLNITYLFCVKKSIFG